MDKKPSPYELKNGYNEHEKTVDWILKVLVKVAQTLKASEDVTNDSRSNEEVGEEESDVLFPLTSFDFFEKIMGENYNFDNYKSLRDLIDIFCRDNIKLSKKIILSCLKNMTHYVDNVFAYLEAIKQLALIQDEFSIVRRDMIFGFPTVAEIKDYGKVYRYGFQIHKNLNMPAIRYRSPLNFASSSTSLLKVLIDLHEKYDSNCFILLSYILEMMNTSEDIFQLIIHTPSPYHLYANFHDWFFFFVKWYLYQKEFITYNSINYDIMRTAVLYEKQVEEGLIYLEKKYIEYIKQHHPEATEEEFTFIDYPTELIYGEEERGKPPAQNRNCLKPIFPLSKPLIVGCVKSEEQELILTVYENENDYISLKISQLPVYATKSLPTGTTNLSLPGYFRRWRSVLPRYIPQNSSLVKFLDCEDEREITSQTGNNDIKQDISEIPLISLPKNIHLDLGEDYPPISEVNARDEEDHSTKVTETTPGELEDQLLNSAEDFNMKYFRTNYLLKYVGCYVDCRLLILLPP